MPATTLLRIALPALLLAGCAVLPPTGPSVLALPRDGKPLEQFRQEDSYCRDYAAQQTGPQSPQEAANNAAVGSAAVGTVVGAAAGALIGSVSGNVGAGAAIGAGSGLLVGSAVGAGNAQASAGALQARYDNAYIQCIASTGNRVQEAPVAAAYPYARPYPGYGYGYPGYGYGYGPTVSLGIGPVYGYRRPYGYGRYYW